MRVASKVRTFLTLGLWVLELFDMYATDRQTDGRADGQKQRLLLPSLQSGVGNVRSVLHVLD